ncbi:hypothetical protein BLNAU_6294 [Blattamonas nauphoetae]|uniref:Uncharacterized protein n=1 Tax=Blattamonas nauphoetae TaxID=2049346 RepID=A0ABQ9Y4X9_9EUKA|nr:hypothetical protein BLNAU_6294 [Blattamonas nauphoetae]
MGISSFLLSIVLSPVMETFISPYLHLEKGNRLPAFLFSFIFLRLTIYLLYKTIQQMAGMKDDETQNISTVEFNFPDVIVKFLKFFKITAFDTSSAQLVTKREYDTHQAQRLSSYSILELPILLLHFYITRSPGLICSFFITSIVFFLGEEIVQEYLFGSPRPRPFRLHFLTRLLLKTIGISQKPPSIAVEHRTKQDRQREKEEMEERRREEKEAQLEAQNRIPKRTRTLTNLH